MSFFQETEINQNKLKKIKVKQKILDPSYMLCYKFLQKFSSKFNHITKFDLFPFLKKSVITKLLFN